MTCTGRTDGSKPLLRTGFQFRGRPRLLPMSAKQVAVIPPCVECGAVWLPADEARWEAYLTDDDPPELAFYCPECARQEFG